MEAATFSALGEPSRLRIVELLRLGPSAVGDIADALGIRQPQVSKHLRVLADAGVVVGQQVARRRIYRLDAAAFEEIGHWLGSFEHLWHERLDALGAHLDAMHPNDDRKEDDDG